MDSKKLTAFLQEHWYFITLFGGVVILIGAIMNWNWLCDPTGRPTPTASVVALGG